MKGSDELFILIKSLTRTEKRYFKLFANGNSVGNECNYLILFDIIDKQTVYDEKKVISIFYKEKEIKHFPNEKKHLYGLLLKSLNKYHSSISKENELNELLNSAQILHKKQLYEQSNKLLDKLILFAEKHELYSGLIKIGELKTELISQSADSSIDMKKEFDRIRSNSNFAIEKLSLDNKYHDLFTIFLEKIRKDGEIIRHPSEIIWFSEFMQNPLLLNENSSNTIKSKSIYYFLKGSFYYISGDNEKAFHYYQKDIEHLESKEISIEPSLYSAKIANMCTICLKKRDYNSLGIYVEKLKNCPVYFPMEKSKLFYRYNDLLIRYFVFIGEFQKAIDLYRSIESDIKQDINIIHKSRNISINYYIASAYLGLGEFKTALIWINKLLDEKTNYRNDLLCFSRILNCIVQLEIGNDNSQESSYRATSYFLKKSDKIYQFEELFIKFFSKFLKEMNVNKQSKLMVELKEELNLLLTNPFELGFMEYFDMISWLEHKLTGKSFSEIIRSKNETDNNLIEIG